MTTKQIFEKFIVRAMDNGMYVRGLRTEKGSLVNVAENPEPMLLRYTLDHLLESGAYKGILYSHEFLKAFFGDEQCKVCSKKHILAQSDEKDPSITHFIQLPAFKFHATEMVQQDRPLDYIAPFLIEKKSDTIAV